MDSTGQMRPLVGGATIQIRMCYSCNGQHDDLDVRPYHRPNPPFTHWYTCPVTDDPVPLSLVVCNNVQHELHHKLMQEVFERQGKPFMFAMFYPTLDGVTVNVHPSDFPNGAWLQALAAFEKNMRSRVPPPPAPLPAVAADQLAMFRGLKSVTQVIGPTMAAEAATEPDNDQDAESDEQH